MSDIIEEAKRKADELDKKVQRAAGAVNLANQVLPDSLAHLGKIISDAWAEFVQKMREFWDKVGDFLADPADVLKLRQYAVSWRDDIGDPLGAVAGAIGLGSFKTTAEWSGDGAEAYKAVVPAQGSTLAAMKALAISIATLLVDLANAIENFWIAVTFAILSLIVAVVSIIASIGPQAVITVPIACTIVATTLGVVALAVNQLKSLSDNIKNKQATLKQGLHDLGDEWARATPQQAKKLATPAEWKP